MAGETIRLEPFWEALKARLSTNRMAAILGGPGRVYLVTDQYPAQEGSLDRAWGRVVIVPTNTLWPEGASAAELRWPLGWLVRADIHDPGGGYPFLRALEAAQDEAVSQLQGWTPPPFANAMIAEDISRWKRHEPLPLWDEARKVWYNSAGYRTRAAPAPPA